MNLDKKRVLDLSYSIMGVSFYYLKKFAFFLNIKLNGINKSTSNVSKTHIKKGILYNRNINYFDVDLSSSGTTGEPTKIWANPMHWISEQSAQYEYFTENGYAFRDKMIILRGYAPKDNEPIFKIDKLRNFIWISAFHLNTNNIKLIKTFLNGKYFLRGYPSSIELLSRLLENEIDLIQPQAIFTASETLTDFQRSIAKKVFGVNIYDWYGTSEPSVILFQTKKSYPNYVKPLFHCDIRLENVSNDIKEKRLIYGKAIWYNLSDFGYYNTGDIALLNNGKVISILGRKSDFIELNYKTIPVTNLLTVLYSVPDIVKFQIVNRVNIEVKFLLYVGKSFNLKLLTNELDKRIGVGNYEIVFTSKFISSQLGKTPFFIKQDI